MSFGNLRSSVALRSLGLGLLILLTASAVHGSNILINFDAGNAGNGQFLNDITVGNVVYQQGALINETLPGNIFHNSDGRSLAQYGNDGYNGGGVGDVTDVTNILNNAGVVLNGWTAYRGEYSGGNNSFGYLENGTRLGASGNVPGNGDAFANAGEFFLFSDVYNQAIDPTDTVNVSFQGGSDNGVANFDVFLLLDGATAGAQVGGNQVGNTIGDPRLMYTGTGFTATTSVQLVIEAATDGTNNRSLIDNVFFEIVPIPEPNSMALVCLGAIALGICRRR